MALTMVPTDPKGELGINDRIKHPMFRMEYYILNVVEIESS